MAPRATGRSSARRPPTPTSAEFVLAGPSDLPDPDFNAYRKDLADVALASRVIASHYAERIDGIIGTTTSLRAEPSANGQIIRQVEAGEPFSLLDHSLGWAWGYAGAERRVGYVKAATWPFIEPQSGARRFRRGCSRPSPKSPR
jgi:hypothetical protein